MQEFSNDSDFHGVRFVFNQSLSVVRRLLWALVVLAALCGLIYFIYYRVDYYFTYPVSTELSVEKDILPVPALAICPSPAALPFSVNWENVSDTEIIYFFAANDIDLLSDEVKGNTVSQTLYEDQMLDRVKQMDTSSLDVIDIVQYGQFLKRHGVRPEHIDSCEFLTGDRGHDCLPYMHQVLTSHGACLVLDKKLHFAGIQNDKLFNYVHITLSDELRDASEFFIYDQYELLDMSYNSPRNLNGPAIQLTKVASYNLLDKPYGHRHCIYTSKSQCMRECIISEMPCIPFYESQAFRGDKAHCKPVATSDHDEWLYKCGVKCPSACHSTTFSYSYLSEYEKDNHSLQVYVSEQATHDTLTQVSLYGAGSLLAEIGGTMGLFIGASVLSLYYTLEYCALRLCGASKKKRTLTWKQKSTSHTL